MAETLTCVIRTRVAPCLCCLSCGLLVACANGMSTQAGRPSEILPADVYQRTEAIAIAVTVAIDGQQIESGAGFDFGEPGSSGQCVGDALAGAALEAGIIAVVSLPLITPVAAAICSSLPNPQSSLGTLEATAKANVLQVYNKIRPGQEVRSAVVQSLSDPGRYTAYQVVKIDSEPRTPDLELHVGIRALGIVESPDDENRSSIFVQADARLTYVRDDRVLTSARVSVMSEGLSTEAWAYTRYLSERLRVARSAYRELGAAAVARVVPTNE